LEWNVRAPLLLAKIMENEPDIICLQELNHFGTRRCVSNALFFQIEEITKMLKCFIFFEYNHRRAQFKVYLDDKLRHMVSSISKSVSNYSENSNPI
jgi:hypothetical protein